jgi:hypothetical protein
MRQSLQDLASRSPTAGRAGVPSHDHENHWTIDPDGIDRPRRVPWVPRFLVRRLNSRLVRRQHIADHEGNRPSTDPNRSDRRRRLPRVPRLLVRRLVLGLGGTSRE